MQKMPSDFYQRKFPQEWAETRKNTSKIKEILPNRLLLLQFKNIQSTKLAD